MIFTFAAICNKLSKLKLLQEFRSLHISIFVITNQSISVLILLETKIQVHTPWNFWGSLSLKSLLQIAVNAKIIENRQKTQSTQFIIKFKNFNFDVWTVKFSPLISCIEDTGTYTLKLLGQCKFEKFITNCGKCENHRKSPKNAVNAICNKVRKLQLWCLNCQVQSSY